MHKNFWPSDKNQKTNFNMFSPTLSDSEKADKLNDHFIPVADNLASQLPDVNLSNLNLEYHPPIFELHEITMQDISEAISSLSSSPSCGEDSITSYMIKCAATELLVPLHHIFNLSVNTASFPA